MKQNAPFIIDQKIIDYLDVNIFKNDDDYLLLKQQTDKMPERKMQITREQGDFLSFFIKAFNVKHILEIGVYTGTSSLFMAKALSEDGHLTAVDQNPEWTKIAKKHWAMAKVDHKISFHLENAVDFLPTLKSESYDLIFIDADKKNYPFYYEESLRLLKTQGFIFLDNVFMNGKVLSDPEDSTVLALTKLYQSIKEDNHVIMTFLPFYDGMLVIQKL